MAGLFSDELSISQSSNNNHIQLLAIDENQFVLHRGSCKIQINKICKQLVIEPINKDDFTLFSIPFDSQFISQKTILCAFSIDKINNIALIFKNNDVCEKVYHAITETSSASKSANTLNKIFLKRLVGPVCDTILKSDDDGVSFLKNLLVALMEAFLDSEKEDLIDFLKHKKVYYILFPSSENPFKDYQLRKRKLENHGKSDNKIKIESSFTRDEDFNSDEDSGDEKENDNNYVSESESEKYFESEIEFSPEMDHESSDDDERLPSKKRKSLMQEHISEKFSDDETIILYKPEYEIFKQTTYGKTKIKIVIFVKCDKNLCYEYAYNNSWKSYYCWRCSNLCQYLKARICSDEDGKECLKLNNMEHFCDPIIYSPENYESTKIIKPQSYQFVKRRHNGDKILTKLVIFIDENKNLCHELVWTNFNKAWYCNECRHKHGRNVHARIFNSGKNNEYAELSVAQHRCIPLKYLPENLTTNVKIVNLPDFKFEENLKPDGSKTKWLIIFDSNDRNFCNKYTFDRIQEKKRKTIYKCNYCFKKGNGNVKVKVGYNEEINGVEPYVEIPENLEHVCELKKYDSLKLKPSIVEAPNFQISTVQDINREEKKYLVIFTTNDKTFCYIYYYDRLKDNFKCGKCKSLTRNNQISVTAKLLQNNETGEEYVKLNDGEHVCKPQKYNPLRFSPITLTTENFELKDFIQKGETKKGLLIFDDSSGNKKLFYSFVFRPRLKYFICIGCERKQKTVRANAFKNKDGTDYIELGQSQHVCQPFDKPLWDVIRVIKR